MHHIVANHIHIWDRSEITGYAIHITTALMDLHLPCEIRHSRAD